MTAGTSHMRREVLEVPQAVDHLLRRGGDDIRRAAEAIRHRDPRYMISVARGSSDHVATNLKYASELLMGVPIASIGPSIASIYERQMNLQGSVCLSVSQSGRSPDIVEMAKMARTGGALSIALTNDISSPLARVVDHTLNLYAGTERSVAATKTFVNSAVTGLWLLAEWAEDHALLAAIRDLPDKLEQAVRTDWSALADALSGAPSALCLGRGPAYAIAHEAALKLKEVCQIHAEAYSSAEVLHGPVSIVDPGFPVIVFAVQDEAETAVAKVADDIAAKGAMAFVTSPAVQHASTLKAVDAGHPLTSPLTLIASFYAMVEQMAIASGIDPDRPRHLQKVTKTV